MGWLPIPAIVCGDGKYIYDTWQCIVLLCCCHYWCSLKCFAYAGLLGFLVLCRLPSHLPKFKSINFELMNVHTSG